MKHLASAATTADALVCLTFVGQTGESSIVTVDRLTAEHLIRQLQASVDSAKAVRR